MVCKDQPKVSIVMPVYNALPYLDQAVRSIFAQTYENWELIIVDDASTDGSWQFVNRIIDGRVVTCRNDRNMRNSYTLNRGIALASGEYIAKMDADDVSFPERIEQQVNFLQQNKQVDAVGCGLYRVDKDLNLITVNRPPCSHKEIVRFISFGRKFIYGPSFQITDGCLLAKAAWFKRWAYDPDIPYAQDFDQNLRAHFTSIFANIPDPLYIYRRVGVTSSWVSQTKAVYYKLISLVRYGFKNDIFGRSLLALVSLAMRPFFAFLTTIYVRCLRVRSGNRNVGVSFNETKISNVLKVISDVKLQLSEHC